jgi:aryl-alcohol dehydrogenase-like predicted oxidoreductase
VNTARPDPTVHIEDTIGAFADMVQAGFVRSIGLSEVGLETIQRAQAVPPITDLQIENSLISCSPEAAILPGLAEVWPNPVICTTTARSSHG